MNDIDVSVSVIMCRFDGINNFWEHYIDMRLHAFVKDIYKAAYCCKVEL